MLTASSVPSRWQRVGRRRSVRLRYCKSCPGFELVLGVHMKASGDVDVDVDAAARGLASPSSRDLAGLSDYLLGPVRDYWQAAHRSGEGPVRTSELAMARAVYTATLTRPLSHREGVIALARAEAMEDFLGYCRQRLAGVPQLSLTTLFDEVVDVEKARRGSSDARYYPG